MTKASSCILILKISQSNVRDNILDIGFTLSPNPASQMINLELSSAERLTVQIELINQLGQIMTRSQTELFAGQNQHMINVSDYPQGIYFVNVTSGNKIATKKVTVVR